MAALLYTIVLACIVLYVLYVLDCKYVVVLVKRLKVEEEKVFKSFKKWLGVK